MTNKENNINDSLEIIDKDEESMTFKMNIRIEKAFENDFIKESYGKYHGIWSVNDAYNLLLIDLEIATSIGVITGGELKITKNKYNELSSIGNRFFDFITYMDNDLEAPKLSNINVISGGGHVVNAGINISVGDTYAFFMNWIKSKKITSDTIYKAIKDIKKVNLIINIAMGKTIDFTSQLSLKMFNPNIKQDSGVRDIAYTEEDFEKLRQIYLFDKNGSKRPYEKIIDAGIVCELCFQFGLRPHTSLQLKLKHINLKSGTLCITQDIVKTKRDFTIKCNEQQLQLISQIYKRALIRNSHLSLDLINIPITTCSRTSLYDRVTAWEIKANIREKYKNCSTKFNGFRKLFVKQQYQIIRESYGYLTPEEAKLATLKTIANMMGYRKSNWRTIKKNYVTSQLW